jgi:dehydration protein DpgD
VNRTNVSQPDTQTDSTADCRTRVRYEKRGRVAYITLDRPEVLNAIDTRMHKELGQIWDDFEQDEELWLAVLTGAGDRAFSVGQDLKELVERNRAGVPPSTFGSRGGPGWPRLTERFSMVKPIIARVNGYVAMGYLMTGRRMSATRAYELGLVNEIVPLIELDACVKSWVEDILHCAPLSVRALKRAGLDSLVLSLPEAFAARYEAEDLRLQSDDCREGSLAFVEKRSPNWMAR